MTQNSGRRPKQGKSKKQMLVRYGRMGALGFFEHNQSHVPKVPTRIVVKTDKGLELGHLVGQLVSYKGGQFKLDPVQTQKYFDESKIDFTSRPVGRVIRYATDDDISEEEHLKKISEEEIKCCKQFIEELKLPMKIVDAEHIFGGERIVFYFMADGRVDFRELVKKLAQEYQSRIEMRQVGSRDEAKLLGDVESCGQQCCCIRFLKALKPVNMRMAKMQKATLDPSKISGYCGRLKCCLRYEDENYTKLKKKLPKKNVKVKTPQGEGRVLDAQILSQLVVVGLADGKRVAFPLEEIEVIPSAQVPREKKKPTQAKKRNDNDNNKQ